jgi:hypothetical protein
MFRSHRNGSTNPFMWLPKAPHQTATRPWSIHGLHFLPTVACTDLQTRAQAPRLRALEGALEGALERASGWQAACTLARLVEAEQQRHLKSCHRCCTPRTCHQKLRWPELPPRLHHWCSFHSEWLWQWTARPTHCQSIKRLITLLHAHAPHKSCVSRCIPHGAHGWQVCP